MYGNIWEWSGRGRDAENEFMLMMNLMPVLGGHGRIDDHQSGCREILYRIWSEPHERASGFGFRVVREWVP
jgi:hypothetical protein